MAKALLVFLAVLIVLAAIPYVITPVYDFPQKQVFSGDKFYNPYDSINPKGWLKANFHSHSHAWGGFTAGRENINEEITERYKALDYDIICISDYMKINTYLKGQQLYLPVYEHGYGFTKNHQLVIGAKEVKWLDYVFAQTIHDKQHTINQIKTDYNVIVLNHPHLRDAYDSDDMTRLAGYDYIEIANQNFGIAEDLWDDALSSGNPVFGMADDDSHNSKNYSDMGKCFNFVNTEEAVPDAVIRALKRGRSIAVDVSLPGGSPFDSIKSRSDNISLPGSMKMKGSVLTLKLISPVRQITFIGQNGKHAAAFSNTDSASYTFLPQDTYIRTVILNTNGVREYLNPVMRCDGGSLPLYAASVDRTATLIFRIVIVLIFAAVFLVYILLRRRQRKILTDVSTAES